MTTEPRRWVLVEPGVLALEGTIFSIAYDPDNLSQPWKLFQGDRPRLRTSDLSGAKMMATHYQQELEEIGVG